MRRCDRGGPDRAALLRGRRIPNRAAWPMAPGSSPIRSATTCPRSWTGSRAGGRRTAQALLHGKALGDVVRPRAISRGCPTPPAGLHRCPLGTKRRALHPISIGVITSGSITFTPGRRPQRLCRLFQKREGAVVAGDHRLEIEECPGGIGGTRHVHGEVPARAEDADIGRVQVVEDLHVGHNVGVAGDIDRGHRPRSCSRTRCRGLAGRPRRRSWWNGWRAPLSLLRRPDPRCPPC